MKKVIFVMLTSFLLIQLASAANLSVYDPAQTVLTKQISLSQPLQSSMQTFFKLPADYILNLQSVILLFVMFLVVFFITNSIISLVPFFEGSFSRFFASLVISLLVSLAGGLADSLLLLSGLSSLFSLYGSWYGISLVIPLAFIAFVAVVVSMVTRGIRKILSKEEAYSSGQKVGRDIAESKLYGRIFKKTI